MKRLFLLLLFVSSTSIFSQNIELGVSGGLNISNIRGFEPGSSEFNYDLGHIYGLSIAYGFTDSFFVKVDVLLEQKNVAFTNSLFLPGSGFQKVNANYNYNFTTIPLLYQYRINRPRFTYFANAGPYFGFLRSVVVKFDDFEGELDKNEFKNTEVGAAFGIGTIYSLNDSFGISLEVRNHLGLSDIDTIVNPFGDKDKTLTNSINLILGITYKID